MAEEKSGKLKQEVEELRNRVQREAEEVERRLSFSGMLDEFINRLKTEDYKELMARNPLALVLLGTGIGMLFRKGPETSGGIPSHGFSEKVSEKAGEWMGAAKAKVAHIKERVQTETGEFGEKGRSAVGDIQEKRKAAMDQMGRKWDQYQRSSKAFYGRTREFVAANPLTFAGGGLVLGALIGAAFSGRKTFSFAEKPQSP